MMHPDDDRAYEIMEAPLHAAIARLAESRFSTKRLIAEIRASADGDAAYREAMATLGPDPGSERMGMMVLHGQVIPGLLRRSGLVRFGGFIHGNAAEDDGFGVPSLWVKNPVA